MIFSYAVSRELLMQIRSKNNARSDITSSNCISVVLSSVILLRPLLAEVDNSVVNW